MLLVATAPALTDEQLPADLEPAGLVVLGDRPRPDAADTLRYFAEQGVTVKVISGDDPAHGRVRSPVRLGLDGADEPVDARELPDDDDELAGRARVALGVRPRDARSRSARWCRRCSRTGTRSR